MIQNVIRWYGKKKALHGLRRKYILDRAVKEIMKEWIKASIIERKQEGRRQEFIDITKEIEEIDLFMVWLNTQK